MKENIEEDIKIVQEFLIEQNKRNQRLIDNPYRQLFYTDEEVQAIENILSDYKRVLKENEELLQEKIDNQKIIALAQNEFLGYEQGYQDGKAGRGSAVQSVLESQQYYMFQKQIERYENRINKLKEENEELKDRWNKDTHKLQNDLDIANAKRIDWEKAYQEEKDKQFELLRENQKLQDENEKLKDYRRRFVDVTDNELKEANYYFMYKYTFRGDELAQYINILLKAVNNSIPKQKIQDITEELIKNNTEDNESVKRFEEMRRNLAPNNDFYKKSYQTSIHKLNAEIVTRKHIINVLQDLLEEKGE